MANIFSSLVLHAIFGLVGFAGALGMSVNFAKEKENLSTLTKTGMIMAYVGTVVSSILGFASATNNNPIVVGGLTVAAVVYSGVKFLKPAGEASKN
ncbi:MAG: hypothetical protein FWF59_09080 [Turicibacter sp.]|nr:hypothetical protein [Turicibacter sp.]